MKAWLYFLLGFILVFAPALAFCGTVTEIWAEKYSKIDFAYIEDGVLKTLPGFEGALMGFMPRNIIVHKVNLLSDSHEFKLLMEGRIYEM